MYLDLHFGKLLDTIRISHVIEDFKSVDQADTCNSAIKTGMDDITGFFRL
jgi:hypothetical protein